MDVAGLSMAMSQAGVAQAASLSVMKIAMESAKVNAANMAEMLNQNTAAQQAVHPHLGGRLDIRL